MRVPLDRHQTPEQIQVWQETIPRAAVEYARIARRGTIDMSNMRPPPESPDMEGITPSGWLESTVPTAAPIAKWSIYKEGRELRLFQAWRPGIEPTKIEKYRAHQQYFTVTTFRCVDHIDGMHD